MNSRRPRPQRPFADYTITLDTEKMTAGGRCLARADGKVYFVEGALPSERVSAAVTSAGKSFAEATARSVERPSTFRIEPACPLHFRPSDDFAARHFCGGCDWQHIDYPFQLELKKQILSDALLRTGKINLKPESMEIEPSPARFRYRNKALVPFAPSLKGGGDSGENVIRAGFFARGSHEIVSAEDCPLQPEIVFKIVCFVRENAARLGIRLYEEDAARGSLRHLYVRAAAGSDEILVGFVVNPADTRPESYAALAASVTAGFPSVRGVLLNENPSRTNVIFGRKWSTLAGCNSVTEVLSNGIRLRLTEGAFFQVNTPVAEKLYEYAVSALARPAKLLDIYAGVGGFALHASRAGIAEIIAVEENETAVNDAIVNARFNDAGNITFYALSAEKFLSRPPRPARGASIIVDPPRSGLGAEIIDGIAAMRPAEMVYVSCDPATFARDAGILAGKGYELSGIRLFDMFPQTHHLETAALFRLKNRVI
ncbi:MAG: 23S rRNA (uracil(1939)-C(5))-methyltransferase RlmD [Elusimicrobia bacterium HGW-Elusimicrobia-1]|nr:MAG: 23S rRNA (uracil(1939)-C(5))-methyltransferase RlmD [Elusimicrobia bacterium HGW-Elusimicrobia-1]